MFIFSQSYSILYSEGVVNNFAMIAGISFEGLGGKAWN